MKKCKLRMAETYRAKKTVWFNLQCRETNGWLNYDGLSFTSDRRYGWRGNRDQLNNLVDGGGAAATCRAVRDHTCSPHTSSLDRL